MVLLTVPTFPSPWAQMGFICRRWSLCLLSLEPPLHKDPAPRPSGCGRLFHVRPAQLFEDTLTPALLLGLTLKPRCVPWAEWDHASPAAKAEAVLLSVLAGAAPVCSLHHAPGLRASILAAVHLWPSQTHSGGLARGQNAPRSPPVPPPTASCLCFSL